MTQPLPFQYTYLLPVEIDEDKVSSWLTHVVDIEGNKVQFISFHFLSNEALLAYNKEYLQHNYYTDIITFDNSFDQGICADIMISVEMVKENAEELCVSITDELHRVMVHGVLHLLGYADKSDAERRAMRTKEDHYLTLRAL